MQKSDVLVKDGTRTLLFIFIFKRFKCHGDTTAFRSAASSDEARSDLWSEPWGKSTVNTLVVGIEPVDFGAVKRGL